MNHLQTYLNGPFLLQGAPSFLSDQHLVLSQHIFQCLLHSVIFQCEDKWVQKGADDGGENGRHFVNFQGLFLRRCNIDEDADAAGDGDYSQVWSTGVESLGPASGAGDVHYRWDDEHVGKQSHS